MIATEEKRWGKMQLMKKAEIKKDGLNPFHLIIMVYWINVESRDRLASLPALKEKSP